jgi:hypothetical protein
MLAKGQQHAKIHHQLQQHLPLALAVPFPQQWDKVRVQSCQPRQVVKFTGMHEHGAVASVGVQVKVTDNARKAVDDPLRVQHHRVAQRGAVKVQPQPKLVEHLIGK